MQDVTWFNCNGDDMPDEDWSASVKSLGLRLAGDLIEECDARGEKITGDTLLLLMNAHHEPVPFVLPVLTVPELLRKVQNTSGTLCPVVFS